MIVVDVAGNDGIDERFTTKEYLNIIKKHLTKKGIFVSNMPSANDIFNKKNKFAQNIIKNHRNTFEDTKLFNGNTSNKIFYKVFFDIDENVLDITNLIIISSKEKINFKPLEKNIEMLGLNITKYLEDII